MPTLIGQAFQSGTITFSHAQNAWAFKRLDAELKEGQENRIVFSPSMAPVSVEPSSNTAEKDLPWLSRTRELLASASAVYLQRSDGLLRFRRALHQVDPGQTIVTLGSPQEVALYAAEHWQKISHFYATRREGFRFDFEKLVVRDKDRAQKFERIEIIARLGVGSADGALHLTFDATGATVHNDLILWRKSTEDGQTARFGQDASRVALQIGNYKQPVSFCDEYHEDFKSHWYLFDAKTLQTWLAKIQKKRHAQAESVPPKE